MRGRRRRKKKRMANQKKYKTYLHTIGINLTADLSKLLIDVNQEIIERHQVASLAYDSWKPHIDILTIRITQNKFDEYLEVVNNVGSLEAFEMTIDRIEQSDNGKYVLLKFNSESNDKIMAMRKKYEELVGKFNQHPKTSYSKGRMESFTSEQRKKVLNREDPYDFVPLLSIIKMSSRAFGGHAMEIVSKYREQLVGKKVRVNELYIGRETYDKKGELSFPEVLHIPLSPKSQREPAE